MRRNVGRDGLDDGAVCAEAVLIAPEWSASTHRRAAAPLPWSGIAPPFTPATVSIMSRRMRELRTTASPSHLCIKSIEGGDGTGLTGRLAVARR